LIGNYKIQKVIGEGGFGRTYLAEHTLIQKKVVIKQSLFQGPAAQQIVLNEASLLWDVNHWALPTVKDVFLDPEGNLLMAMSFIEGEQLLEHVQKSGPLDAETACWIAQRILSALYYLHFAGIVHRDVKPANVIVNFGTHIAVLVDFGLSKLKPDGSPDASGYTPYFGAPEQVAGKAPIPESDIYSLGMTLLFILGGDIRNKMLPSQTPKPLQDFIYALVREDPLQRPRDCQALNQELGGIREKVFGRKRTL
jgi:serine/threonine protein kinase